jgi:hypothetical protein
MKVLLPFFLFLSLLTQGRLDSLHNRLEYNCTCSENLIIQGTATKIKTNFKNKNLVLYRIPIDTLLYQSHYNLENDSMVYVIVHPYDSARFYESVDLFVLRRCYYSDSLLLSKMTPTLYYEVVTTYFKASLPIVIIPRSSDLALCQPCQTMRPLRRGVFNRFLRGRRNNNFQKKNTLDEIEKYILKNRNSITPTKFHCNH